VRKIYLKKKNRRGGEINEQKYEKRGHEFQNIDVEEKKGK